MALYCDNTYNFSIQAKTTISPPEQSYSNYVLRGNGRGHIFCLSYCFRIKISYRLKGINIRLFSLVAQLFGTQNLITIFKELF